MNKKRAEQILTSALDGREIGQMSDAERAEVELARTIKKGLGALKEVPECQLSNERLREAVMASLSPAQRAEFETAAKVNQGLAALREVPQHQLSNERLRDAILGQAVAPKRTSPGWNYAFGVAACIALAAIAIKLTSTPVTPDNGGAQPIVASGGSDAKPDAAATFVAPSSDEQTAPVVRSAPRANREVVASAPAGPSYHDMSDASNFRDIVGNLTFGESEGTDAATPMALATESAPRGSIVVVDSASTTEKGAARATEMSSYGDVVFGG